MKKLSRREFLKGTAASAVGGGLLLSRREALEHPLVAAEDKAAIERSALPRTPAAQEAWEDIGPEYLLWHGRLYWVTHWTRNIPYEPDFFPSGQLCGIIQRPEELTITANLMERSEW